MNTSNLVKKAIILLEAGSDELVELTKEELLKLDLVEDFWSIAGEIKKHSLKTAIIYALKNEEKVVAILITQKNRIIALQSLKEGYGTKIVTLVIKKMGRSIKLKGAVMGAIEFYYKVGFELDRQWLEVTEYNTINMKYCSKATEKISPKERMNNDIAFLEEYINNKKEKSKNPFSMYALRPFIAALTNLKRLSDPKIPAYV